MAGRCAPGYINTTPNSWNATCVPSASIGGHIRNDVVGNTGGSAAGGSATGGSSVSGAQCGGGYVRVNGKCVCNAQVRKCPAGAGLFISSTQCACGNCASLGQTRCQSGYRGVVHSNGIGCDCVKNAGAPASAPAKTTMSAAPKTAPKPVVNPITQLLGGGNAGSNLIPASFDWNKYLPLILIGGVGIMGILILKGR